MEFKKQITKILVFGFLLVIITLSIGTVYAEPVYMVSVKGQITQAPLPCSTECNPESPDFDGPNPDLPVGTGFEITYWFDTIPEKSFEMATARDYEGVANVEVKFGSNVVYEGQSIPVRIFVNDDDNFYYDTFEIEDKSIENLSGDGDDIYQFDFRVSDETKSMLNSLDLPSDSDFFSKNTETEVIFGFVGGKQAIGILSSMTINGESQNLHFSDIDFELSPNEITITGGGFVEVQGEITIASYDESHFDRAIEFVYNCGSIVFDAPSSFVTGASTWANLKATTPEDTIPGVYNCLITVNTSFANEPASQEIVIIVKETTDDIDDPSGPCPVGGCLSFDGSDDNDLECLTGYELKDGSCTKISDEIEHPDDALVDLNIFGTSTTKSNFVYQNDYYLWDVTVTNYGTETAKNVEITADVVAVGAKILRVGTPPLPDNIVFGDVLIENVIDLKDIECTISSPYGLNALCPIGDLPPNSGAIFTIEVFTGKSDIGRKLDMIFEVYSDTPEEYYENNIDRKKGPIVSPSESDVKETDANNTLIILPDFFKNNARWISEGKITDGEVLNSIEYLIQTNVVKINSPISTNDKVKPEKKIPEYMRTVFGYWADDLVSDREISDLIEYLLNNGIITVPDISIHVPFGISFFDENPELLEPLFVQLNYQDLALDQAIEIRNFQIQIIDIARDSAWEIHSQNPTEESQNNAVAMEQFYNYYENDLEILVDLKVENQENLEKLKDLILQETGKVVNADDLEERVEFVELGNDATLKDLEDAHNVVEKSIIESGTLGMQLALEEISWIDYMDNLNLDGKNSGFFQYTGNDKDVPFSYDLKVEVPQLTGDMLRKTRLNYNQENEGQLNTPMLSFSDLLISETPQVLLLSTEMVDKPKMAFIPSPLNFNVVHSVFFLPSEEKVDKDMWFLIGYMDYLFDDDDALKSNIGDTNYSWYKLMKGLGLFENIKKKDSPIMDEMEDWLVIT